MPNVSEGALTLREALDRTFDTPYTLGTENSFKISESEADDDHMEPLDRPVRDVPPSHGDLAAPTGPMVAMAPVVVRADVTEPTPVTVTEDPASDPTWASAPPNESPAGPRADGRVRPGAANQPMAPWRIVGALALTATFALMGWQVRQLADDQPWSNPLMLMSVAAGIVAAFCVLGWTWITTGNAKRLVEPAVRAYLPDPRAAVLTWIWPFTLVGVAVGIVAVLGARSESMPDNSTSVSTIPVAIAVIALLLAVPMTYRPLNHLAAVVRQVGGYSVRLAQWMWVPVVLGVVGIGSIVAMRFAGIGDSAANSTNTTSDVLGWAPLWVVAVAAVAPCVIVVLLAWRAASSVEDAITIAATRRSRDRGAPGEAGVHTSRPARRTTIARDRTDRINLVPGADLIRLVIVTLLAGVALMSVVGAAVVLMLWFDSRDTGVLLVERQRASNTLDALEAASSGIVIAILAAVSSWTFIAVANVRMTSGRRRNPLVAALAWPAAGVGVWWIADRMIVDGSIGRMALGFAAQAGVLLVPFLLLERSADAIGARRTPLRIVFVLAVVLLVHVQAFGRSSPFADSVTTTEIGRLAVYLAIGALVQLCSTLAVTEACQAMTRACRHEADHHNMLVDQRTSLGRGIEPAARR